MDFSVPACWDRLLDWVRDGSDASTGCLKEDKRRREGRRQKYTPSGSLYEYMLAQQ